MKQVTPAMEGVAVSARYGARTVLSGLDFVIPKGQMTVLLGPNGSGKTTLLHVLAATHPVAEGRLLRHHQRRPALVPQHSQVSDSFPITVRQTVAMGRWADRGPWRPTTRADKAVVAEALDQLGIADLAGRRLGMLSGGQRQRVLLAQALAQRSDVVLLDEPTAGLDVTSAERIHTHLARLRSRGVTIVQSTHEPEAAATADHRIHLGAPVSVGGQDFGPLSATHPRITGHCGVPTARRMGRPGSGLGCRSDQDRHCFSLWQAQL
ncbi:zinc ABC transporter ATP-binding protein AztA [Stackebrandtia nassauensis]|uniref:ABC transporter related protein n=1 Tax=Stackebrandtia nassauensis (strain DSM 44728 / CIP 108903 / NRRL B-16338 / NBRC 102104 / LLR-40K-21) TaxID=446470 RepID=D3Q422_STANL|nr:zinc ABC transporter ATP-binding protein AztA [Stackebrandtia nassauensis]ADD45907.1 ABC transporter related protein [Stackebrandtia nassauensis DSM 44728]